MFPGLSGLRFLKGSLESPWHALADVVRPMIWDGPPSQAIMLKNGEGVRSHGFTMVYPQIIQVICHDLSIF